MQKRNKILNVIVELIHTKVQCDFNFTLVISRISICLAYINFIWLIILNVGISVLQLTPNKINEIIT